MNYIYDIYLNLNEKLYDFVDWNKNDKLIHIKKIPIIKIDEEKMRSIISSTIKISDEILLQIYKKTETWNSNKTIPYCTLFSDGSNLIAIEFNAYGKSIRKSNLYIDEELEILEIIDKFKEKNIDFKILKNEESILKTRKQIKDDMFIHSELKNISKSKLNYIYFECFGKQETSKKVMIDSINNITRNSKVYKNLYDILKLTSTTKK